MSALRLIFDNDADLLARRLAGLLTGAGGADGAGGPVDAPDGDPLAADVLIVANFGVGRWLQQRVADELGVACVLPVEMPAGFLWRIVTQLLDQVASQPPFDPQVLSWIIYAQLTALANDPDIEPQRLALLHARLRNTRSNERMMLARSIADCFHDLLGFRRHWLDAWARGARAGFGEAADGVGGGDARDAANANSQADDDGSGDTSGRSDDAIADIAADDTASLRGNERWLSWMWRQVLEQMPVLATRHPFDRFADWIRRTQQQQVRRAFAGIGVRSITVYGVPPLAPEQIRLFGLIARHVPVTFLVTDPCREFWQDIVSDRELAAIRASRPDVAWLYDNEPSVLGAWGKSHRDYLAQLRALEETLAGIVMVHVEEAFRDREPAPPSGRLQALQQAILTRSDACWAELPQGEDAGADYSLQVHCCHGANRQIEVLRDRLLHAFETVPDLQPDEVLVLAPDIDALAPFIDGVFGDGRIPYAIEGRRRAGDAVHEALSSLLLAAQSQPGFASVQALLENPALGLALRIDDDERNRLLAWLERAGFRGSRGKHGWQSALDRLWFGAAIAPDPLEPAPVAGGTMAIAGAVPATMPGLGKLARLFASLDRIGAAAHAPAPLARWCALLAQECEHWFGASRTGRPHPYTEERLRVHDALACLVDWQARALAYGATLSGGADSPLLRIDLAAFIRLFEEAAAPRPAQIRPGSGVTFAPIHALRGVPARVIALIGLSESDFPQARSAPDFDLIAQAPRFGDQLRGNNDRGAFLDALTHARDQLIITFDGRDLRSNEALNPSAVIAECMFYVDRHSKEHGGFAPVEHSLMPFSPQSFRRPQWPAYDRGAFLAASVLAARSVTEDVEHFIAALPTPGANSSSTRPPVTDGDEWVRMLAQPAQAYLRRCLHLALPKGVLAVDDHEPVDIGADLSDGDKQRLQRALEAGLRPQHWRWLREGRPADPQLPEGAAAVLAGARIDEKVARMQALARKQIDAPLPEELRTETVSWQGIALRTGWIDVRHAADPERLLQFVWSAWKPGAHSMIDVWFRHLAAQLWAGDRAVRTIWLHDGRARRVDERYDAGEIQRRLLALLESTVEICTRPLPLFPRTALAAHRQRRGDGVGAGAFGDDGDGGGDAYGSGDGSGDDSGGEGGGEGGDPVRKAFALELASPWYAALYRDGAPDLQQVLTASDAVYGPIFEVFETAGSGGRRPSRGGKA